MINGGIQSASDTNHNMNIGQTKPIDTITQIVRKGKNAAMSIGEMLGKGEMRPEGDQSSTFRS